MTLASIMDELDTRGKSQLGCADGRLCIGERVAHRASGHVEHVQARGQRSPEENRKSKAACVMSSCGGGFRAHKASYLSWRHARASKSGSVRSS